MPHTVRSRNLDLIRWLNYGHKNTCEKLASVANSNYISKMATGDREIDDYTARRIESKSGLPDHWMDRDHVGVMKMGPLDWDALTQIWSLPDAAKKSLLTLLAALKAPPEQQPNS